MSQCARAIRENTVLFLRQTSDERAKLLEIESDIGLTNEGRRARLAPLQAKIAERHAAIRATNTGLVQSAEVDERGTRTDTLRRAAALADPVRVNAIADMVARLRDEELIAVVDHARTQEKPDLPLAFAIASASGGRLNKMAPELRDGFLASVRAVGTPPHAVRAQADAIAARVELARFDQLVGQEDSVKAVTAARLARVADVDGTGPRALTDAEVEQVYNVLGLPLNPVSPTMPKMRRPDPAPDAPEKMIEDEEGTPVPVAA